MPGSSSTPSAPRSRRAIGHSVPMERPRCQSLRRSSSASPADGLLRNQRLAPDQLGSTPLIWAQPRPVRALERAQEKNAARMGRAASLAVTSTSIGERDDYYQTSPPGKPAPRRNPEGNLSRVLDMRQKVRDTQRPRPVPRLPRAAAQVLEDLRPVRSPVRDLGRRQDHVSSVRL
jgi:hypothetical protein